MTCDICADTRSVRIPTRSYLGTTDKVGLIEVETSIGKTYREFACPACTRLVPKIDHISVFHQLNEAHKNDPDYLKYQNTLLARRLGEHILEHMDEFVTTDITHNREWGRTILSWSVGLVTRATTPSYKEELKRELDNVAMVAAEKIYAGEDEDNKFYQDFAVEKIREAIKEVLG